MEEEIGEKAVKFDQNSGGDDQPDRRQNRGARQISLHELSLLIEVRNIGSDVGESSPKIDRKKGWKQVCEIRNISRGVRG
jgi:hypothetical protein